MCVSWCLLRNLTRCLLPAPLLRASHHQTLGTDICRMLHETSLSLGQRRRKVFLAEASCQVGAIPGQNEAFIFDPINVERGPRSNFLDHFQHSQIVTFLSIAHSNILYTRWEIFSRKLHANSMPTFVIINQKLIKIAT